MLYNDIVILNSSLLSVHYNDYVSLFTPELYSKLWFLFLSDNSCFYCKFISFLFICLGFYVFINRLPQESYHFLNFLSRHSDPSSILFHFPKKVYIGDSRLSLTCTGCHLSAGKQLFSMKFPFSVLRIPLVFLFIGFLVASIMSYSFLVHILILWGISSSNFPEWYMGGKCFKILQAYSI